MDLHELLKFGVTNNASDVHIQTGLPPRVRIGGIIRGGEGPTLTDEVVRNFITSIVPARLRTEDLDERITKGLDFSYAIPGQSRFRCSAYKHLGTPGIVMRIIKGKIPTIAELNLPPVINDIAMSRRGL